MPSKIVDRVVLERGLTEVKTSTGLIKYESIAYAHDSEEQKTYKGIGRAEAKRLHHKHQADFEDATPSTLIAADLTLGQVRDLAWTHHESLIAVEVSSGEKAPLTAAALRNHKGHWEKRITPFKINGRSIDNLKIAEVNKPVARAWLKYLRTSHGEIASQTRNAAVSAFRNTLRYARDSDYMDSDPFHSIPSAEFPKQRPRPDWTPKVFTEVERDLVIEAAQSKAFIEATGGVLLTNAVILIAVTGVRLAEALGIRHRSIEMGEGDEARVRVRIREQRVRHKAGEEATTKLHLKNGQVAERVTLSSEALTEAMQRQTAHELDKGRGLSDQLLFTDTTGRPITDNMLKLAVRRACKIAGLGNHGPQVLRRTLATTIAQRGGNSADGSAIMGHSQATYEGEYVKPIMDERKLRAIEELVYGQEAA